MSISGKSFFPTFEFGQVDNSDPDAPEEEEMRYYIKFNANDYYSDALFFNSVHDAFEGDPDVKFEELTMFFPYERIKILNYIVDLHQEACK